jgi:hypothetical protein
MFCMCWRVDDARALQAMLAAPSNYQTPPSTTMFRRYRQPLYDKVACVSDKNSAWLGWLFSPCFISFPRLSR